MSTLRKILCVILCFALVAGVAALSAAAMRNEAPAGAQTAESPWWAGLPGWIQWVLRNLFFGWLWMKPVEPPPVTEPTTTVPVIYIWPDNEFTNQVPKPKFDIGLATVSGDGFVVLCGATIPELRDYVSDLKEAGFTENTETTDTSADGIAIYRFSASNDKGYSIELGHILGMSTFSITKVST